MEVIKTGIEGVVVIEPRIFKDERGYFFESFSQREFNEKVDVAHAHGGADRGKDEADAVFEIGRLVLLHEKAFLSAAAELRPAAV